MTQIYEKSSFLHPKDQCFWKKVLPQNGQKIVLLYFDRMVVQTLSRGCVHILLSLMTRLKQEKWHTACIQLKTLFSPLIWWENWRWACLPYDPDQSTYQYKSLLLTNFAFPSKNHLQWKDRFLCIWKSQETMRNPSAVRHLYPLVAIQVAWVTAGMSHKYVAASPVTCWLPEVQS